MKSQPVNLTYEIELLPGETFQLPPGITDSLGAGRWLITIQPLSVPIPATRNHDAFLSSYSSEDEGLYDDYTR
jgi:hypothetical protein